MIYSVWVPGERRYDYYSVGGLPIEDDTPTPSFGGGSKIGFAPGEATWDLPANAQKVGTGVRARGIVIHPGGARGALGSFTDSPTKWLLYAGLAYAAYYILGANRG